MNSIDESSQTIAMKGNSMARVLVIGEGETIVSRINDHFEVTLLSIDADIESIVEQRADAISIRVDSESGEGIRLCKELKMNARTRGIPVLVCLPKAFSSKAGAAFNAGADDVEILSRRSSCILSRIERLLRKGCSPKQEFEKIRLGGQDGIVLNDYIPDAWHNEDFQELFEDTEGAYIFIKDLNSRYLYGNGLLLDRFNLEDISQLVRTSPYSYLPSGIAANRVQSDRSVFETGNPIRETIELCSIGGNGLSWVITTKLPVFDKNRQIRGLVGVTRKLKNRNHVPAKIARSKIYQLIDALAKNTHRKVTVREMAGMVGLTSHMLNRQFETFGISPQDFELLSRIQAASVKLLRTSDQISEIAIEHGFYDQSAFSNRFKEKVGCSPRRYRAADGRPPFDAL